MLRSKADKTRICFILSPSGSGGGGMGRIKDYILQSLGEGRGSIRFVALDTRGTGNAAWSMLLTARAILWVLANALMGRVAFVHVNIGDRGSYVRKTIAIVLLRLAGIKVVMHLHTGGLMHYYAQGGRVVRAFIRLPFRVATCCVALGNNWRDWAIQTVGADPRKVEVVYNGAPISAPAVLDKPDQPGSCHRLLFLGNLIKAKGLSELFGAVAQLPVTVGDWRLTIAGAGDIEPWKAEADALGVADRVSFLGWVDAATVRTLLAEADVLLLPSHEEALPLVVLEALGMGTPVLCTPVGALPEILENMSTAVFTRPHDTADLCCKLQRLLDDPALRQTLARNGRVLYEQQFTLAAFARNLFAVYHRHCDIAGEVDADAAGAVGIETEMTHPQSSPEGVVARKS